MICSPRRRKEDRARLKAIAEGRSLALPVGAAGFEPATYRRSPDARCPSAIEESDASAEWIVEHGAEKGLDPARVAVAGDPVGGNKKH